MPFIQLDIERGLVPSQKAELLKRFTAATHAAIGSSIAHINVVIREHEPVNISQAGRALRQLS